MTQAVMIYNAGGLEPLGQVSLRHAVLMMWRGVARAFETVPGQYVGQFPRPRSVELVRYVYAKWKYERTGRLSPSTDNVLRRDRHKCAYCGRAATTRDHVMPLSRGGRTEWSNLVAACRACNEAKKARTPAEAGLRLRLQPFVPTLNDLYPNRL
ncbi:MAG: HNH endonuclease [Bifidobacteriaceae bacterium]|jgi:hypothetical protein|nr:HNH endonuclease [Bifidobacteriaceae bacterium]